MKSKICRWGNSLGTIIPKHIVKKLNLHSGSPISFRELDDGGFAINVDKSELNTLIEKINDENRHHNLLEDSNKGNEVW